MLTTETFRKAARDPAEFGSYYLSHYFTRRSPPFHRQLSALWRRRVMKNRDPVSDCAAMLTEKGTRSAIAAPRGHAKSTVMSLQNVLHAALFGYKRYILLVSDTEAQAVSFLDAIKNELETNERILADFGEQNLEDRLHPALQRLSDRRHRQRPEAAGTAQLRAPPGSHPLR